MDDERWMNARRQLIGPGEETPSWLPQGGGQQQGQAQQMSGMPLVNQNQMQTTNPLFHGITPPGGSPPSGGGGGGFPMTPGTIQPPQNQNQSYDSGSWLNPYGGYGGQGQNMPYGGGQSQNQSTQGGSMEEFLQEVMRRYGGGQGQGQL